MPEPTPRAECDAFAAEYDGGLGDPLKRLVGGSAETFFEHKDDWLMRNVSPRGRLLDFGCGSGRAARSHGLRHLRSSAAPSPVVRRALPCAAAARRAVRGGRPQAERAMTAMRDLTSERTISDFGEQWVHYGDNEGFYGSTALFSDIIEPLLTLADFRGACVAEIGSGAGRIVAMMLEAGAAHVLAVEPSDGQLVAQRNLARYGAR